MVENEIKKEEVKYSTERKQNSDLEQKRDIPPLPAKSSKIETERTGIPPPLPLEQKKQDQLEENEESKEIHAKKGTAKIDPVINVHPLTTKKSLSVTELSTSDNQEKNEIPPLPPKRSTPDTQKQSIPPLPPKKTASKDVQNSDLEQKQDILPPLPAKPSKTEVGKTGVPPPLPPKPNDTNLLSDFGLNDEIIQNFNEIEQHQLDFTNEKGKVEDN